MDEGGGLFIDFACLLLFYLYEHRWSSPGIGGGGYFRLLLRGRSDSFFDLREEVIVVLMSFADSI